MDVHVVLLLAVQGWSLYVEKTRQLLGQTQTQQALHHDQFLINACIE